MGTSLSSQWLGHGVIVHVNYSKRASCGGLWGQNGSGPSHRRPHTPMKAVAGPHPRGALLQLFLKRLRRKRAASLFSTSRTVLHAARTVKSQVERSEYNNQPSTASETNLELTTATPSLWHISISRQRVLMRKQGACRLFPRVTPTGGIFPLRSTSEGA